MQAKDVPEIPVLKFIADSKTSCTWFWSDACKPKNSVVNAMPEGTPEKVALAKVRQLIKRGLVEGCNCGCRGDFEISEKGRQFLDSFKIGEDNHQ